MNKHFLFSILLLSFFNTYTAGAHPNSIQAGDSVIFVTQDGYIYTGPIDGKPAICGSLCNYSTCSNYKDKLTIVMKSAKSRGWIRDDTKFPVHDFSLHTNQDLFTHFLNQSYGQKRR